jgi:hypothetical protein
VDPTSRDQALRMRIIPLFTSRLEVVFSKTELPRGSLGHAWSKCSPYEPEFEASSTTASSNTSPLSFKVRSTTFPDSSATRWTV